MSALKLGIDISGFDLQRVGVVLSVRDKNAKPVSTSSPLNMSLIEFNALIKALDAERSAIDVSTRQSRDGAPMVPDLMPGLRNANAFAANGPDVVEAEVVDAKEAETAAADAEKAEANAAEIDSAEAAPAALEAAETAEAQPKKTRRRKPAAKKSRAKKADDAEAVKTEADAAEAAAREAEAVEAAEIEAKQAEAAEIEATQVEVAEVETVDAEADEAAVTKAEAGDAEEIEATEVEAVETEADEIEAVEVVADADEAEAMEAEAVETEIADVETEEVVAPQIELSAEETVETGEDSVGIEVDEAADENRMLEWIAEGSDSDVAEAAPGAHDSDWEVEDELLDDDGDDDAYDSDGDWEVEDDEAEEAPIETAPAPTPKSTFESDPDMIANYKVVSKDRKSKAAADSENVGFFGGLRRSLGFKNASETVPAETVSKSSDTERSVAVRDIVRKHIEGRSWE